MEMKRFKQIPKFGISMICLCVIINLLFFSKELSLSLLKSLETCFTILIPSLFLFMAASNFIVNTGVLDYVLFPFRFITKYVFRCDPNLTSTIIMSMIGGYPVGARLLSNLYFNGKISKKTVERMLCFCVNAGPSFIIGAVSIPLFNSVKAGIVIFLSQVAAAFCVGLLTGIGQKREKVDIKKNQPSYSSALVDSVNSTLRAMANMCGFVLLFSGLLTLLKQFGVIDFIANIFQPVIPENITQTIVYGILEITNGISISSSITGLNAVVIVSMMTAFGGLCVHMQIFSMFKNEKIDMRSFYASRFLYVVISSFLTYFICANDANLCQEVFIHTNNVQVKISQISPIGSIFMIILSLMLLLSSKKSVTM